MEVDRSNITLLSSSKSIFEGSTFSYESADCDEECEYHDYCFPEGLVDGDKCIVLKNHGKHKVNAKKDINLINLH